MESPFSKSIFKFRRPMPYECWLSQNLQQARQRFRITLRAYKNVLYELMSTVVFSMELGRSEPSLIILKCLILKISMCGTYFLRNAKKSPEFFSPEKKSPEFFSREEKSPEFSPRKIFRKIGEIFVKFFCTRSYSRNFVFVKKTFFFGKKISEIRENFPENSRIFRKIRPRATAGEF